MKIGELSRLTGVRTSRIRFYEKHGLIPIADRYANGYRDYPAIAVDRVKTILMCQGLGFSLSEIKRALPDDPSEMMNCDEVIQHLQAKLADVEVHIADLQALHARLRTSLAEFETAKREGRHLQPVTP